MSPIQNACAKLGGQAALARELGLTAAAVSQWVAGIRPVPAEHCPRIERLTDGEVRCEELLPNVDWAYLRASRPTPELSRAEG